MTINTVNLKFLLYLALFLHKFVQSSEVEPKDQPERNLLENLLKDYDRDARPVVKNTEKELTVKVSITLKRIVELDVKNQMLNIYIWLMQEWNDQFLTWDPLSYANLSSIQVPAQRIWLPDLELYNSADDQLSLSDGVTKAIVKFDGNVSWIEPKDIRANCPVNVFYFPFDEQVCKLQIGSWTMHGDKLDMEPGAEELEVVPLATQAEHWSIVKTALNKSIYIYSCCPEPYVDVTATLHLKRNPGHNVLSQILPSVIISLVAVLASRLSPESPLRFLIEIVVLLTFLEVVWDVTSVIPVSINGTPLFVIYLVTMITLTSTSILLTAYVASLASGHSTSGPVVNYLLPLILRISPNTPNPDLTRDDIPLTQYSFNNPEAVPTNNGDISMPIYPSLSTRSTGSSPEGAHQQLTSNGRSVLVARKLDSLWFKFFAVATCAVNFVTFFILIL